MLDIGHSVDHRDHHGITGVRGVEMEKNVWHQGPKNDRRRGGAARAGGESDDYWRNCHAEPAEQREERHGGGGGERPKSL